LILTMLLCHDAGIANALYIEHGTSKDVLAAASEVDSLPKKCDGEWRKYRDSSGVPGVGCDMPLGKIKDIVRTPHSLQSEFAAARQEIERRRGRCGSIKSRDKHETEDEFNSQKDEIKKDGDVTAEYRDRLLSVLESALVRVLRSGDVRSKRQDIRSREEVIRAITEQIKRVQSDDFKIYGYEGIVKNEEDYHLGECGDDELFLALDMLAEFMAQGPETLVDEYLLHEMLCPMLGHDEAIELQRILFPEHYTEKYIAKHPKGGLLGSRIRDYINYKDMFTRFMKIISEEQIRGLPRRAAEKLRRILDENPEFEKLVDLRPIAGGLLSMKYVLLDIAAKRLMNPHNQEITGICGGAGSDASNVFLSSNAKEVFMVDESYGEDIQGTDVGGNGWEDNTYLESKYFSGYAHKVEVQCRYFRALILELRAMGVSEEYLSSGDVERYKKEYIANGGNLTIHFKWRYPGSSEARERVIHLVKADATKPQESDALRNAINKGVHFYYQRAGMALPIHYVRRFLSSYAEGNPVRNMVFALDNVEGCEYEVYDPRIDQNIVDMPMIFDVALLRKRVMDEYPNRGNAYGYLLDYYRHIDDKKTIEEKVSLETSGHIVVSDALGRVIEVYDRYGNCVERNEYRDDNSMDIEIMNVDETSAVKTVVIQLDKTHDNLFRLKVIVSGEIIGEVEIVNEGGYWEIEAFSPVEREKYRSNGIAKTVFNWIALFAKRSKIPEIQFSTTSVHFVRIAVKYLSEMTVDSSSVDKDSIEMIDNRDGDLMEVAGVPHPVYTTGSTEAVRVCGLSALDLVRQAV